ncbi:nli interacting factor-like phosphatase family protein [Stylonychia lemnae]|uniref:Mitochondrial import inner membrane translocase subunit TIM50 n=1 Tax=Stylonychia lemnae TaxID=5949 RepID=A0A078ASA8_STYLE|nr:nli interacting factor-like phosphatase family protein [Stylonychia lemnae]|eukprot:CDW83768.1 nli interacting factor-like phosphatase family protein [Stylonychia lemnae]
MASPQQSDDSDCEYLDIEEVTLRTSRLMEMKIDRNIEIKDESPLIRNKGQAINEHKQQLIVSKFFKDPRVIQLMSIEESKIKKEEKRKQSLISIQDSKFSLQQNQIAQDENDQNSINIEDNNQSDKQSCISNSNNINLNNHEIVNQCRNLSANISPLLKDSDIQLARIQTDINNVLASKDQQQSTQNKRKRFKERSRQNHSQIVNSKEDSSQLMPARSQLILKKAKIIKQVRRISNKDPKKQKEKDSASPMNRMDSTIPFTTAMSSSVFQMAHTSNLKASPYKFKSSNTCQRNNLKGISETKLEFNQHQNTFKSCQTKQKMTSNEQQFQDDEFRDVPFFPEMIMQDFFERKKILTELKSINQTFNLIKRKADLNLKNLEVYDTNYPKKVQHQKTIIFDMDETMIKIQKRQYKLPFFDSIIKFKQYGVKEVKVIICLILIFGYQVFIQFRPYLRQMLKRLSQHFELIVYTSGEAEYAKSCINAIEGNESYFQYRLTKDNCVKIQELGYHAKDLRLLQIDRDLKDMIIVDNQVTNFMLQIHNGIPIKEFQGDKSDQVLKSLTQYLLSFKDIKDVRKKIHKDFDLISLIENKTSQDSLNFGNF